jgi:preprotein translocase subunit SecG
MEFLMEIVRNIIFVIYFIVCLALIILVLSQTKEDNGASGAIVGGSSNNFYEKNKGRTREGKIKRATVTLMVIFFVLTIILGIIYVA